MHPDPWYLELHPAHPKSSVTSEGRGRKKSKGKACGEDEGERGEKRAKKGRDSN